MKPSVLIHKAIKLYQLTTRLTFLRALVLHGVAATTEHFPVLKNLQPNMLVDIGANKGQFSLAFRGLFGPKKVIAFEPLQNPGEKFGKIFMNDPNVELIPFAIGEETGKQTMHISNRMDSSSLLSISPLQDQIFPGTGEVDTKEVNVAPLSSMINPDQIEPRTLMKIDVQGAEYEVLKSSSSLLEYIQWVYIECSFQELYLNQYFFHTIVGYMTAMKYHIQDIRNIVRDTEGKIVQCDVLFVNTRMEQ